MSRAEIDIRHAFEPQAHVLSLELELDSSFIQRDILIYFQHHMHQIRDKMPHLGSSWPGDEAIQLLVSRSSGLFVWASTAAKFIDTHHPQKRLDIILNGTTPTAYSRPLDSLYQTALQSAGSWDDEDFVADFLAIISIILALRTPFSNASIDRLRGENDVQPSIYTVEQLSCVISSMEVVRVVHPCFSDFLLDLSRCGRDIWFFDKGAQNRLLANLCLNRLRLSLKFNLCNLTLSRTM